MGSKAVEKFRSRHPSHHLLLSSLSMRLAVERRVDKKKTLARLKSVNSRTVAEEDMMENRSQMGKPYDRLKRLMSEKAGGKVKKERGHKTVRWSQQLIKVNTHQRLLKWNETHKLFAGPPAEPLTSHRRGASGNLSHFKLQP